MASASPPTKNDNRFTVSSLLSPPETKRQDSFSSPMQAVATRTPLSSFSPDNILPSVRVQSMQQSQHEMLPLSPPISPFGTVQKENIDCVEEHDGIRDPQLFGSDDVSTALEADLPLFTAEQAVADAVVSRHIASNGTIASDRREMPTREEYLLAISCVSRVVQNYNRNPQAYLRRERELWDRYGKTSSLKATRPTTLRKLAPAPAGIRKQRAAATIPRIPRAPRVQRTPQMQVVDSFELYATPSPKAPRVHTNRDDFDYEALPDFSPPLSTLPKNNNKILKADWKGQVLDLSADPDRHLLHEAELNLAATLRLSCATYLCSKRRIFQARIEALKKGKEFRKTDAQQACKIDVNKASKLWTAYEKVGWFRREFFEQCI